MNITVTKNDIEQGQRRDPEQCAVARALVRAGLNHFGVMGPSVMVGDRWGGLTSVRIPREVSDWIFNFDAGNAVSPISFDLGLPDEGPAESVRKRNTKGSRSETRRPGLEKPRLRVPSIARLPGPRYRRFGPIKLPRLPGRMGNRLGLTVKLG